MITTQKALRNEFWYQHPQFKRVPGWKQNDYKTDVRVAWCEWIDDMYQSDQISKGLVERATL
jgi:hypothetical protein